MAILNYPPHIMRAKEERRELLAKIKSLSEFTNGLTFQDLPEEDQDHLDVQLTAMQAYAQILNIRLKPYRTVEQ